MNFNFEEVRRRIMRRSKHDPPGAIERGDEREALVEEILKKMQSNKLILSYIKVPKFSYADIKDGIDFYLIVMRLGRVVIPLQVTGPHFVSKHKMRHPEIHIVSVPEGEDKKECIYNQIKRIIDLF